MTEQRKPIDLRIVSIFAAGLLLGGGAVAWFVTQKNGPDTPPEPAVRSAKAAEVVKASAPAAKSAPALAPAAAHAHVACPAGPLIAAAGREDGLMRLKNEPNTPAEIAALILTGKESAAAGRPRDAELTFLAACRAADQLQQADATAPTDARYQLARHYAHVVLVGNAPAASRAELLKRAELLYQDSVLAYRARHGESHEKTRFASDGLATLRQSAQAAPAAPPVAAAAPKAAPKVVVAAPAPAPAPAAPPAPVKPTAVARTVAAAEPAPPVASPRPRRAPRAPEPEVIEAPVQQATGAPNRRQTDDTQ